MSGTCDLCRSPVEEDTPEHALFNCTGTDGRRLELEATLKKNITTANIIEEMLESEEKWNNVCGYLRDVMKMRTEAENRREGRTR